MVYNVENTGRASLARSFKIADVVDNNYRITNEAMPSLAGKLYKAHKCNEGERKAYLLLQLHTWVACHELPDTELPWQRLSAPDLFVLDMKGLRMFEDAWQESGREQIATLFLPVFAWLKELHTTQRKKFPFLHCRNILLRDNSGVAVLGNALDYDYLRSPGTPYDYLVSPNYLNSLKFQQAQHSEPDDYYPLAVMVWETWQHRKPEWDANTQKFIETVAAGPYTSMVKAFIEGNYSHLGDPAAMLQELSRQPWQEEAKTPDKSANAAPKPLPVSGEENGEGTWPHEQIRQLEQERQNLYRDKQQLCRDKESLYQEKEAIKGEFHKKITLLWATVGVGMALPVLLVLGLYLYGFRLLSPDLWHNQENWRAQKNFWHTVALCQSNQGEQARLLCENSAQSSNKKLVYTYLKTLSNVQLLAQETDSGKRARLQQEIAHDLATLKKKQDEFARELTELQVPTTAESVNQLLKVYGKAAEKK
jgi:hypothetical protein